MESQSPAHRLTYPGLLKGEPRAASWLVTLSKVCPTGASFSHPLEWKWGGPEDFLDSFNSKFCMMTLGPSKSPAVPQGPLEQPQNFVL